MKIKKYMYLYFRW